MGGGSQPPGFPVSNPSISFWQVPAHRIAHHRTTSYLPDTIFDYIIVGSGISGAATALKLLTRNPGLHILMLEARTAASGASGRNGGHCRAGWWLNFKRYAEAHGEEEALRFEQLEEGNVRDIADFVHEHDVDCDFVDLETADTYGTREAWQEVLDVMKYREDVARRTGRKSPVERRVWHGRAATEHLGLPNLVGAVTYPAHTQNPYRLVCQMLELSLEKGLNLQTETLVLSVAPSSANCAKAPRWEVQTDRGVVRSKRVVLATNAYTNSLHRGLASTNFLKPSRSQISAVRSQNDLSKHATRGKSIGVNDRGSGDYFFVRQPNLKGEGDVLYGGGRSVSKTREMGITDDSKINDDIAAYLKASVPAVFGPSTWGDRTREVSDWSGITCYTPDTFPLVGQMPGEEGLWASVGMNGHGMAMAFRCAEALVQMMLDGQEPEWLPRSFKIERAWKEKINPQAMPAIR